MVSPPAIFSLRPTAKRLHSPTIRLLLCPPKYPDGHINTLHGVKRVPHIVYTSLTLERFKRATFVSFLLGLRSSSYLGRHNPGCPCSSRSMGSRARDATAVRPRSCLTTKGASFPFLKLKASLLRRTLSDSTHLDRCRLNHRRIVLFPKARRPGPFCGVVRRRSAFFA
jgi:hypothetical protein